MKKNKKTRAEKISAVMKCVGLVMIITTMTMYICCLLYVVTIDPYSNLSLPVSVNVLLYIGILSYLIGCGLDCLQKKYNKKKR